MRLSPTCVSVRSVCHRRSFNTKQRHKFTYFTRMTVLSSLRKSPETAAKRRNNKRTLEARETMMAALKDPRHQQFAELVASGTSTTDAYAAVGFSKKTAYTCGARLLKSVVVRARIDEVLSTAKQSVVAQVTVTKAWVIGGLMKLAESSSSDSVKCRAYELCGKQIGMFVDHT